MSLHDSAIAAAVDALMPEAADLFATLARETADPEIGITRPSYGEGETIAFRRVAEAATRHGLVVGTDAAANCIITAPGAAPKGAGIVTGSHLDSVPMGGNFDGLAGVVAGWLAAAALRRADVTLANDLTVIGMRGEESAWFSTHHIGSRAAIGLLPADELDSSRRFDSGRTLGEHMTDLGCDVAAIRAGTATFAPADVAAFLEVHIEQGPVLVYEEIGVGLVTGIRGNLRARAACCIGETAHSGAVPRGMRHDAALAVAEFLSRAEAMWIELEAEGRDMVLTFGKVHTDIAQHSHNKVPGRMDFCIDVRSHETDTLDIMEAFLPKLAAEIGARRGVTFDLGRFSRVTPAPMAASVRAATTAAADALGIRTMEIASGGGHDAGDFANAGVPAGMIFVRNPNGSHNPDEAMALEDFAEAVKVLALAIVRLDRAQAAADAGTVAA
ncbi:Zn-dependent hydrolase [Acuticoccus mangrovi]|uniref:Zn-dependent hydrolase n=1 Tax=Acuticoccus mangrovi TaxID=2796142 RepID=A0A934ITW6_9HYPH|nr:Zn-dependent hydrolase [Acuticoccus mangrovi]MBJ3778523.1 Zn-dependent hydrolase [Acuticoccus mangrovi]